MRVHAADKIQKLKSLRRRGYSINELVVVVGVPKTTVWHHIQDITVSPKFASILQAKRGGSAKRKAQKIEEARGHAQLILRGPHRDLGVAIAMLHWCEGHKNSCEFINSDGKMVKLYLYALQTLLGISMESIKPTLRIFSGMDQAACLRYWSQTIGIPSHRFVVRFNDGGTRGRTPYGMCRITVRRGSYILKALHAMRVVFLEEQNL